MMIVVTVVVVLSVPAYDAGRGSVLDKKLGVIWEIRYAGNAVGEKLAVLEASQATSRAVGHLIPREPWPVRVVRVEKQNELLHGIARKRSLYQG
jgi:hypothetical protein